MSRQGREGYTRLIKDSISKIRSEFERNPFNFLSEDDVKCRLFMKLWVKEDLSKLRRTEDGQRISALHGEVTYFDERHNLNVHADISIIDPKQTNVYSGNRRERGSGVKLSKRYEFRKSFAVIEIKLNRGGWSKSRTRKYWIDDLNKLQKLQRRIPGMKYFSILFDKRGHLSSAELDQIRQSYPGIVLIYGKPHIPVA